MQKNAVLVSWIGSTDLRAPRHEEEVGLGPLAQALQSFEFGEVVLLSDFPAAKIDPYPGWLSERTGVPVRVERRMLSGAPKFYETHGSKTRAAELVGLPSYQTFTNWMKRYGVDR